MAYIVCICLFLVDSISYSFYYLANLSTSTRAIDYTIHTEPDLACLRYATTYVE